MPPRRAASTATSARTRAASARPSISFAPTGAGAYRRTRSLLQPGAPMRRAPIALLALAAALTASFGGAHAAFPGRDGRIVYAGRVESDWEIYTMRPDGSSVRKLTNNLLDDSAPVWSPNGHQIAFRSERSGNPEIYVMDANGRHVRRITHSSLPDTRPSWSADGKRIVFQHFVEGGSAFVPIESDIAVVNVN